jgi:hypothetical protein
VRLYFADVDHLVDLFFLIIGELECTWKLTNQMRRLTLRTSVTKGGRETQIAQKI